jgi:hypothetical protein
MDRHRIRSRLVSALALASALVLLATPAFAAPSLVRVSGPSPFAGCSTPKAGGVNYLNAEVEPYVAANPANPSNLIGVWQQDRWSNGGARGLMAGYSFDGGKSWGRTALPFNRCVPGGLPYDRASDPWVSIGPDGTAYAVGLSFDETTAPPLGSGPNAVSAATSTDGGKTWGNVQPIATDSGGHRLLDKESVTADPTRPGTAYAVWDRLFVKNSTPTSPFRGPAFFSKTTDGGRTWSAPRAIAVTGLNEQTIGNQIVVDARTHTIYDFYAYFFCTCPTTPKAAYVKSTDGGATWSNQHVVGQIRDSAVVDPNTGQYIRTEDFTPNVAIDQRTGQLYVTWQDGRFSGGKYPEVGLTTSTDGGRTWSRFRRVSTPTGRPAFTPTVAVDTAGTVGLTYYDFRRLQPGNKATLPTDYWFKTSPTQGRTFSPDLHVAGPFNMLAAPDAGGPFVGDYEGLTAVGTAFQAFFVQTNCRTTCPHNATDVYTARLPGRVASGAAAQPLAAAAATGAPSRRMVGAAVAAR